MLLPLFQVSLVQCTYVFLVGCRERRSKDAANLIRMARGESNRSNARTSATARLRKFVTIDILLDCLENGGQALLGKTMQMRKLRTTPLHEAFGTRRRTGDQRGGVGPSAQTSVVARVGRAVRCKASGSRSCPPRRGGQKHQKPAAPLQPPEGSTLGSIGIFQLGGLFRASSQRCD